MKQLKKTLLTLVALLAVTTGAWADETPLVTIESKDYKSFTSGSKTFDNIATVTFGSEVSNYGDGDGWTSVLGVTLTVTPVEGITITRVKFTCAEGSAFDETAPFEAVLGEGDPWYNAFMLVNGISYGGYGVTKIEVYGAAASSGPTVDWNKTAKTGTFDMPGGNVELEPEYYPQAALTAAPTAAEGAKATTDDLLVSGGTVATITGSDPAAPQGTLMYYVSLTNMSTEALLALDADKWVAEPTAAGITQKCGAFVYYYVKGNDSTDDALNFSDGDISSDNFLNVAIYPAPTYAVTFADDTAEPTLWTASPAADVTKGQTVTVTYTGSKKVLGVKAEKKAAAVMTTVTWNSTNVFNSAHEDVELSKWYPTPLSYEGITISFSGTKTSFFQAYDEDDHIGSLLCYGNNGDSFTFTAPSGKKFCKIEIINNGFIVFTNYGDWTRDATNNKIVWSGTAANAVTLGSVHTSADNLNSIVFYLSE